MSIKLSENTFSLGRSRFTAVEIADRSASASAIRGELMSSFVTIPCVIRLFAVPVMVQANPAFLVCLFHAASDLQVGVASRSNWVRWTTVGTGAIVRFFDFFGGWARFHSLASRIPFVAVSSGDRVMFSKMRVFRAFHMDQQTQDSILLVIPEGGRQITVLKATRASLKSSSVAMWTTLWRGILFHTSLAKGQWKKVWHADSCSLHLTHTASELIPLVYRFSPKERAFWMIDQMKTRIFRVNLPFHTSLIQLNSKLWDVSHGFWEATALYPDFVE